MRIPGVETGQLDVMEGRSLQPRCGWTGAVEFSVSSSVSSLQKVLLIPRSLLKGWRDVVPVTLSWGRVPCRLASASFRVPSIPHLCNPSALVVSGVTGLLFTCRTHVLWLSYPSLGAPSVVCGSLSHGRGNGANFWLCPDSVMSLLILSHPSAHPGFGINQ